jgi:hypothetical protein
VLGAPKPASTGQPNMRGVTTPRRSTPVAREAWPGRPARSHARRREPTDRSRTSSPASRPATTTRARLPIPDQSVLLVPRPRRDGPGRRRRARPHYGNNGDEMFGRGPRCSRSNLQTRTCTPRTVPLSPCGLRRYRTQSRRPGGRGVIQPERDANDARDPTASRPRACVDIPARQLGFPGRHRS